MTRIECTGSVRSVLPAEDSALHNHVAIIALPGRHPECVRIELTTDDQTARAFAAQYHRDRAVRIVIEVDEDGAP